MVANGGGQQRESGGESGGESGVHYGCHEFRDDSEQVIQGRGHPALERMYQSHLAACDDCQRYHDRLEAVYRKPCKVSPLDSFARDHEFAAIMARTRTPEPRRTIASASVGLLSAVAAILALALMIPSFGARLFGPGLLAPSVAKFELTHELGQESGFISYDHGVYIPARATLNHPLGHQARSFARVIGGSASLINTDGRASTGDSLTVGTLVATAEQSVQLAFVGQLIANFQPDTTARWHSASPRLIEFGLLEGALAVRYDRSPSDPILQIRTPSVLVRVVGTVFTVAVDERGHTTVSVMRGTVDILDPQTGRSLAAVEAGFRYDSSDSSYRQLGRREVAIALPLTKSELRVSISDEGELSFEEPLREPGQIPASWTVPGLSDDPAARTLDRVLDRAGEANSDATPINPTLANSQIDPQIPPIGTSASSSDHGRPSGTLAARANARTNARANARTRAEGEAATRELIDGIARAERERTALVEGELERCRKLQAEVETRFRAARCLGDFMRDYGDRPEAVEGLLILGTLHMDFGHDYQSATRNFQEFLRRAPNHASAELAHYKLILAGIEAGYISRAIERARVYLDYYPDGQYVGRILQRFPELKSDL